MEKLSQFLAKRPAVRLQIEHEGSFGDWARHFVSRMPLGHPGRLSRLIVRQASALDLPGVDPVLLANQLERYPLVSTADHAGLLTYGILYNANLLFAGLLGQQVLPYQLVLATARIPLNNVSHPRGFRFNQARFNLFPEKLKRVPVCLVSEALPASPGRKLPELVGAEALKCLDGPRQEFLGRLLFDGLGMDQAASEGGSLGERLPVLNARLWPHFFAAGQRPAMPALVYLTQEPIVRDLLSEDLADPGSLVWRILFEPAVRDIYLAEFDGVHGCWNATSGSHFFWGVSPRRSLYALRVAPDGAALVPLPGVEEAPVPLRPESIVEALLDKRIIPTLFLDMLMLAFVEGYTLLGGFNQTEYLAWMRVQHERCLLRLGEWPLAARFARTRTDGLICGPLPFPQWPSSLDMIWHHNSAGGRFNGTLDGGLGRADLEAMAATPMRTLIRNGVDAMLDVIE